MFAGVAQLAEQLICNQQVAGSSPIASSILWVTEKFHMDGFPSGQREQTVNLPSPTSVVRIHLFPPENPKLYPRGDCFGFFFISVAKRSGRGIIVRDEKTKNGEQTLPEKRKIAKSFPFAIYIETYRDGITSVFPPFSLQRIRNRVIIKGVAFCARGKSLSASRR